MRPYTHLAQNQRCQIHALLREKTPLTRIARTVNVHKSTISREVRRNRGRYDYFPALAHRLALDRRRDKSLPRISRRQHVLPFPPDGALGVSMEKLGVETVQGLLFGGPDGPRAAPSASGGTV